MPISAQIYDLISLFQAAFIPSESDSLPRVAVKIGYLCLLCYFLTSLAIRFRQAKSDLQAEQQKEEENKKKE